MTRPLQVYIASGVVAFAPFAVAFVLTRAGLLSGPAWPARLGPWAALVGLCLPFPLLGLLYLGAAALLARLWHDQAAWDAWPATEARNAVILVGGALLFGVRALVRR